MALDARTRSSIYGKFAEMLGDDDANALMSQFPSVEADELVTKQFLRAELGVLRGEMGALGSDLRGEMGSLRSDLEGEVGSLRSELRGGMDALRSDLEGEAGSLRSELRVGMDALRSEFQGGLRDLASELRSEIGQQGSDLRSEIRQQGSDLRGEIGQESSDLRGEIGALRLEMVERFHRQTVWLVGTVVASAGAVIAAVPLLS